MASKKAKTNYRRKMLHGPEGIEQSLAEGGIVDTLKNRGKKLDELEVQAVTPKPAPVKPTKPVPIPTPAPVEARKKFLGLFADGGYIDDYVNAPLPKMSSHRGQLDAYNAATARGPVGLQRDKLALERDRFGLQKQNQMDQFGLQQQSQMDELALEKERLALRAKEMQDRTNMLQQAQSRDYYEQERKRDLGVNFFRTQPLVRTSVGVPTSAGVIPGYADGGGVSQATALYNAATENLSTRKYANKYDGPGGVRDIPAFANGGVAGNRVYGEGGPTEDKVKIRVSPGEFVLPADTVKAVGAAGLRRLIAETHTPVKGGPGMNMGGKVWDWLTTWGTKAKAAAAAGADAWSEAEQEAAKPKATLKNSGRTPGWRSGTAPNPAAWTTANGLAGPGGGTSTRPPPPTPPPGSGLGRVLPKQESAIGGVLNRVLPVARSIPQLNRGVGLALAAAPYVGIAGSIGGGDHVPSPGGDTSDIPTVSPEFVTKTANLQAQPSTQPAVNNFGADRNPAERGLSNAPKEWPQPAPPREGEGVVSGSGSRSLRTSDPGQLQFQSTAGQPSIDETNAAARAEMAAMDAKKATENAAYVDRLGRQNAESNLRQAAYDKKIAVQRQDPALMAEANAREGAANAALQRDSLKTLKGMDEAGANTRAGMLAASAKYRDDQGLRGNMINAQAQLASNAMNNQRAMQQALLGMREKHGADFDKFLDSSAITYAVDKDGKQVPDLAGTQAKKAEFMKYLYSPAVNNAKFLSQFGATSIDDLPKSQWAPLWESFQRRIALTKEAPTDSGDPALQGMPTGIRVSRMEAGDAYDSSASPNTNAISVAQAWTPDWLKSPEGQLKATISTKGRQDHNVSLEEYLKKNPEKASDTFDMVEKTQGKEYADGLRKMFARQR
jgi:hypothetical protein